MTPQEIRDRLEKGDQVYVVVRYGNGLVKRKGARVLKVMRGAVSLNIEGEERPRTVGYAEIELPPDVPKPKARREEDRRAVASVVQLAPRPGIERRDTIPEPELAPAQLPQPATEDVEQALDVWIEMGEEMRGSIEARAAEVETEIAALEEDKREIEERIAERVGHLGRLRRTLRAMEETVRRMRADEED